MATVAKPGAPPDAPLAVIGAIAGVAVAALLIAFGPMLVAATGLIGGTHGALWDESVFTAAIFGAMLLAALIGGALTGVRPFALGARPGTMLALGAALGLAGILAGTALSWIARGLAIGAAGTPGAALLLGLVAIVLQVVAEESYFRGGLQPLLARVWGVRVAVPLVAAAFAGLHVLGGAANLVALANLFLGGLAFGLLAARAGGIAPAIGMHLAWNGTEQLLLGLDPNPGVGGFGAMLDLDLVGSPWWGGSAEGMNASIGMTVALLAILAPLLIYARRPV
ncbi:CPBP family intramembrane glutamic endopeptidase [Sphingomonas sp. PB4P5]|uniref:CPBP family intramembrane glutamic endopeptidase n=1 Tax=Parasphingomonas puruogangriensis TaxID=3096155 RepID=UPI002FCA572D